VEKLANTRSSLVCLLDWTLVISGQFRARLEPDIPVARSAKAAFERSIKRARFFNGM
jgi:hypothetical protein